MHNHTGIKQELYRLAADPEVFQIFREVFFQLMQLQCLIAVPDTF